MIVRYSVAARKAIEEQAEYMADHNPQAARGFLLKVRATAETLLRFPGTGRPMVLKRLKTPGVRNVTVQGFPNHMLVYRVGAASIDVLFVTHAARDLPRVLGRALRTPSADEF